MCIQTLLERSLEKFFKCSGRITFGLALISSFQIFYGELDMRWALMVPVGWYKIGITISYGYVASYMVYLLTIYLPEKRNKKHREIVAYSRVFFTCDTIHQTIERIVKRTMLVEPGKQVKVDIENLQKADLQKALSALHYIIGKDFEYTFFYSVREFIQESYQFSNYIDAFIFKKVFQIEQIFKSLWVYRKTPEGEIKISNIDDLWKLSEVASEVKKFISKVTEKEEYKKIVEDC